MHLLTLATFNNRGDRRGDSTTLVDPSGDWVMTLYSDQTIAAIVRRREGRGGNLLVLLLLFVKIIIFWWTRTFVAYVQGIQSGLIMVTDGEQTT